MDMTKKSGQNNDTLEFAKESKPSGQRKTRSGKNFKLLIVDDENEIHVMTKLVLSDYRYQGADLEFISAFSGEEAKETIRNTPDIACVLLDVVMETKDAGLEVARFIREDANNEKTRIILRTGQPGKAPEKEIILNYDINDYKEKTELTTQKLFTTVTTALRSYIHLNALEQQKKEIESKNIRLNEEIARRIVAESNLTKYNRSLEKMIESKSKRLETAIAALKKKEKELRSARKAVILSDLSTLSVGTLDKSNTAIQSNLDTIDRYRHEMTLLLEKYNTFQEIILNTQKDNEDTRQDVTRALQEIESYKSEIDLSAILEKYPDIIRDSTRGIEQISEAVADIKRFITIDQEPFEPCNLSPLIALAVQTVKERCNGKADFQMDLENPPRIPLPRIQFCNAIAEIIKNACQSISSKGIVSVACQVAEPEIFIRISDMGCGIHKQDLPKIFRPYYTTRGGEQKGLGLTLARSTVLRCGGDIDVASTHGEGTTVTISLRVPGTAART